MWFWTIVILSLIFFVAAPIIADARRLPPKRKVRILAWRDDLALVENERYGGTREEIKKSDIHDLKMQLTGDWLELHHIPAHGEWPGGDRWRSTSTPPNP